MRDKKLRLRILNWSFIFFGSISLKLVIELKYLITYRKRIDWNHPITLDDKIQWMKLNLYNKHELIRKCADKYLVREYIKNVGCENILNEVIGVYKEATDIPWEDLPSKFVIKWNFGSGFNIICNDKSKFNYKKATSLLNKWKKNHKNYFKISGELQYKGVKPFLLVEKFIETVDSNLPVDYKVYCFNGIPKYVLLCLNRGNGKPTYYFFDKEMQFKRLNRAGLLAPKGFTIPKPIGYEKLFEYAEIIAKPFPFVRADFYLENGQVIFGELTFTPNGGFDRKRLKSTNTYFGSLVNLNSV